MPLLEPARSPLLRYGCAVVSTLLMTALRLSLPFGPRRRFFTFYFAVMLTAWFGGLGPSVLAILLSCLAAAFFLVPPYYSLQVFRPADVLDVGLFVAVCAGIAAFSEAGRAALRRLEREVGDRRRTEQAERAQRQRHQTTLASIGDGVIVTDAQGQVVSLNPIAEGLTGWVTNEAAGHALKQVFRTLDEETHETAELPVAQVVRGEDRPRQMRLKTELPVPPERVRPCRSSTARLRSVMSTVQ